MRRFFVMGLLLLPTASVAITTAEQNKVIADDVASWSVIKVTGEHFLQPPIAWTRVEDTGLHVALSFPCLAKNTVGDTGSYTCAVGHRVYAVVLTPEITSRRNSYRTIWLDSPIRRANDFSPPSGLP